MTTSKAASSRSRPFAVEALDRLPQLADRLDDVLALGDDRLEPLGKLLLLFLGAQIDRAQPLALDLQPFEPALDLGDVGQRRVGLQPGLADHQMRRRVQRLLDARLDLAAALVGGGQPLLGARARSSRASASAWIAAVAALSSAAWLVLGLLQPVGRRLAQRLGLGELRQQRAAALRRSRRARRPAPSSSACGLVAALAERGDLRARHSRRAASRCARSAAMAASRRGARFGLALQPVMGGARIGQRRAVARNRRGQRCRSRCLQIAEVGRCGQLRSASASARCCLGKIVAEARSALRRAPRAGSSSSPAAFSARASASRASPTPCCASRQACARPPLGLRRARAPCASAAAKGCLGRRAALRRSHGFGIELGEAVLLRQALARRRRRIGAGGQAVPAPQRAVAADQPLAGREQLLQPAPVGGIDDADLRQPAGKLRRRAHDAGQAARPSGSAGSPAAGSLSPQWAGALRIERQRRDPRRARRRAPSR